MDKFESQFSDLDVQTSYMEGAMSSTTATTTPQDQVDLLINQVADEAGLERQHELGNKVPQGNIAEPSQPIAAPATPVAVGEEDGSLAQRLRALRVSIVTFLCLVSWIGVLNDGISVTKPLSLPRRVATTVSDRTRICMCLLVV